MQTPPLVESAAPSDPAPLQSHGLLVVDKPSGWTSHDIVARARRALRTRAIGHTGTLDPAATGVLVLAVGEATKLVAYLSAEDKVYEATVRLGTATDTLDADGQATEHAAVPADLRTEHIAAVLRGFIGIKPQTVPAVSAVQVDGQRLHHLARRGKVIALPVRQVELYAAELLRVDADNAELHLHLHCGKGFYVRSLARDLAEALGTLGHLGQLRRHRVGRWSLDDAVPMAMLEAAIREGEALEKLRNAVIPLARAAAALWRVNLTAKGTEDARHGRRIHDDGLRSAAIAELPQQPLALFDAADQLVAIAELDAAAGSLRIRRGFVVTSFASA